MFLKLLNCADYNGVNLFVSDRMDHMPNLHRYSHHAKRALSHAGDLALRYAHPHIDTAHLLVGVILAEGSIGAKVLDTLNLE